MRHFITSTMIFAFVSTPGALLGQAVTAIPAMPLTARPATANFNQLMLPANSEITFELLDELDSRSNRKGDRFTLRVSEDVMVGSYVVIPRGSRGVGEITRLVKKGAFGKSGKIDVRLSYVTVGSNRIPLSGQARERGAGGTTETIGAAILVGVFSAFVTGRSAVIPARSTIIGYTEGDIPITTETLPGTIFATPNLPARSAMAQATISAPDTAALSLAPVAPGGQVTLIRAHTTSGFCVQAPVGYRGNGSKLRPAVTSATPRCDSIPVY